MSDPAAIAARLTDAKLAPYLKYMARFDGGIREMDGNPRIEKLEKLGLVERFRPTCTVAPRWPVTDLGRLVLAALDKEPK